jgi:hypothetical protein
MKEERKISHYRCENCKKVSAGIGKVVPYCKRCKQEYKEIKK